MEIGSVATRQEQNSNVFRAVRLGVTRGSWWGLVWFLLAWPCALQARQPFAERVAALTEAITRHGADFANRPASHARVAWVFFDADDLPDALVILRRNRNDCEIGATATRAPCRGLLLLASPQGGFSPAAIFPYAGQALYLGPRAVPARALYHTENVEEKPLYIRYALAAGRLKAEAANLPESMVLKESTVALSDRAMDTLAEQAYTAQHFPVRDALLSPVRLQVDAVNVRYKLERVSGQYSRDEVRALLDGMARALATPLTKDAQALGRDLEWLTQLNVRAWVCTDWVVPRMHWDSEQGTFGDVGICLEPAVYLSELSGEPLARVVTHMRSRLLQEIATAYLLRGELMFLDTVATFKQRVDRNGVPDASLLGAAAATFMAHRLELLSLDQMLEAQDHWERLAMLWFRVYEERRGFVDFTPELQRFVHDLAARRRGIECAAGLLALTSSGKSRPGETRSGSVSYVCGEEDAARVKPLLEALRK